MPAGGGTLPDAPCGASLGQGEGRREGDAALGCRWLCAVLEEKPAAALFPSVQAVISVARRAQALHVAVAAVSPFARPRYRQREMHCRWDATEAERPREGPRRLKGTRDACPTVAPFMVSEQKINQSKQKQIRTGTTREKTIQREQPAAAGCRTRALSWGCRCRRGPRDAPGTGREAGAQCPLMALPSVAPRCGTVLAFGAPHGHVLIKSVPLQLYDVCSLWP